jgi:hypothetical protein
MHDPRERKNIPLEQQVEVVADEVPVSRPPLEPPVPPAGKTRFRLVVSLYRMGLVTHKTSLKGFHYDMSSHVIISPCPLLQGLAAIKPAVPIVMAQTLDQNGGLRPVFPPYVSIAGVEAFGSVAVCLDPDGVVRRFSGNRGANPRR